MDVPLLKAADTAVFPEDIKEHIRVREMVTTRRERFPEFVTEYFGRLCGVVAEEKL